MAKDDLDYDEIAFNLAPVWRAAAKQQFGDRVSVDCHASENVPEYHGGADIVVVVMDKDHDQGQIRHPKQEVVDFVMSGIKKQNPKIEFALDPLVKPRP